MQTAELLRAVAVTPASARTYRADRNWRDQTHLDDLRGCLARDPERVMLIDRSTPARAEITAAELARRVERLADALRDVGVRPSEAVAYELTNRWEAVALFRHARPA
jgi:non-ribosomal peptide synthetase component E (peptide arylation enzyme)